ncbi:MAG: cytochrome P450 [Alphaproteobacteria bacterium]
MLEPVSHTYEEDFNARGPKTPPVAPLEPPALLYENGVFTQGQPYGAFRTMREQAPVMWHPMPEGPGFWALTRYDHIRAVELDTATFSSQKGGILMTYGREDRRHPLLHRSSLDTMICLDQPYHIPLRREHMPFFTPGYVEDLRRKVDVKVSELLDGMAAEGPRVDMVERFSAELPLFTLCEILGVDQADRPKLIEWMHFLEIAGYVFQQRELGEIDADFLNAFLAAIQEMFDFGQATLKQRRAEPRKDLLSAIANAKVDGDLLPDEYLDGSWLLIVFAGNDTTRNSLSGTMKLLTEFPQEKRKLIEKPELIGNMVHEAIRMVSPVVYMRRTATRDAMIGDQPIGAGEKVIMYYGAANRDPAIFPEPDRFDVTRPNAKDHIAFGLGPHVCLGQRVANMQLEAAYKQILARFPDIAWTGEIDIAPNNFVHAIRELKVDLGPQA